MQAGDHLTTPRTGYQHHGIYVGSGKVIHYGGYTKGKQDGVVVITSLNAFTQGRGYLIKRHWFRRFNPAKIVARAVSRLGERRYRLIFNNCEAFVMWCIWGVRFSNQVGHHALGLTLAIGMLVSVWG